MSRDRQQRAADELHGAAEGLEVIAVLDIPRATGEFAKAIAFRQKLAYERPSKRDDELVWAASAEDAPRLSRDIADTLAAMG